MPAQQSQTLEQLLHDRVSEFVASDKPKEIIDTHVEKMFTSVIDNAFRTYGDMGKAVEEAIKAAMPGNVGEMMDLARYNSLIANAVKEKWAASGIEADMVRRAGEAVDAALEDMKVPEFVSLQKLLEAFAEHHAEEAMQSGWEAPRVDIEEGSLGRREHMHIYFDKDPEESRYSTRSVYRLDNRLAVSIDDEDEQHEGHPVGRVYAAEVDGDVMGRKQGVWVNDWEKLMVALYYGGAKLVLDCDPGDITYPCCD